MGQGLSMSVRRCSALTADEQAELYEFSNSLMAETREAFLNHVSLQDLAFIFRTGPEKQLVGISLWRTVDSDHPWVKIIVQGALIFYFILFYFRNLVFFSPIYYYSLQNVQGATASSSVVYLGANRGMQAN